MVRGNVPRVVVLRNTDVNLRLVSLILVHSVIHLRMDTESVKESIVRSLERYS